MKIELKFFLVWILLICSLVVVADPARKAIDHLTWDQQHISTSEALTLKPTGILTIYGDAGAIAIIYPSGKVVTFGDKDEIARAFWKAIEDNHPVCPKK